MSKARRFSAVLLVLAALLHAGPARADHWYHHHHHHHDDGWSDDSCDCGCDCSDWDDDDND